MSTTMDGIPVVGLAGAGPAYTATAAAPENGIQKALDSEGAIILAPSLENARLGAPIQLNADRQAIEAFHRPKLDFSHLPLGTPFVGIKSGVSVARPKLKGWAAFCGRKAAAPYLWFDTAPDMEGPDLMPVMEDMTIIGPSRKLVIGGTQTGGGRAFRLDRVRIEDCQDPDNIAVWAASSDGTVRDCDAQHGRFVLDHASIRSGGNKVYGYLSGPAFVYGSYVVSTGDSAQDGAGNGCAVNGSDGMVSGFYADSVGIGTAGTDAQSCSVEVNGPRNTVNARVCMRPGRGGLWVGAHGTMHWVKFGPNAKNCDVRIGVGDETVAPFVNRVLGQAPSTGSLVFI